MSRLKVYDLATASWLYAGGINPTAVAADAAFTSKYAPRTSGAGAPAGTGVSGDRYYDTTNKREYLSDGIGWIIVAEPVQTYTPTTVGVSLGGGSSLIGSYQRSSGHCDFIIWCNLGSSSAGVLSTGPTFSMPFAPHGDEATQILGLSILYDATGPFFEMATFLLTGSLIEPRIATSIGSLGQISNTSPITIAVNDRIQIRGRYRMLTRYL